MGSFVFACPEPSGVKKGDGSPWLMCCYMFGVSLISAVAVMLTEEKAGKSIMD